MVRTLALSRFTLILSVVACQAACGGSDTIDDDASATAGAGGGGVRPDAAGGGGGTGGASTGGGGTGGAAVGDGSLADRSLGDVALGADSPLDAVPSDAKADISDVGVDGDANVTIDGATDAAVSLDAVVSLDANADVDAAASIDATADVSADVDAGVNLDGSLDAANDAGSPSILGPAAETFAVLAGQTVTNSGLTIINGNLGLSPLATLGGTPPTVLGSTHLNDLLAQQAQGDLTTAYNALAGKVCGTILTGQDLGGLTLTPGVYCFTSSAQLTGTLTLNGLGSSTGVWVFEIASTLVTSNNSQILMTNGGNACNVYWQVGSSATIGDQSVFSGNVLALANIAVQNGSVVTGRMLSRAAGSVTLASSTISIATCPGAPLGDGGLADAEAGILDASILDAEAGQ